MMRKMLSRYVKETVLDTTGNELVETVLDATINELAETV
jgi:hypothetical protein